MNNTSKNKKPYNGKNKGNKDTRNNKCDRKPRNTGTSPSEILDSKGRNNNPNWYFMDKGVAEMTSALSFQQLAGNDIELGDQKLPVPNIVTLDVNPCPGVQMQGTYSSGATQKSAINLAGFRIFSKLAAYTGRQAVYGPQDISTMILQFGEVISQLEWIRRVFGVSMLMSMRNRAYPRAILKAMLIDSNDLFTNLADYRMQFNTLITRINQLPIPQNIAYFDKCRDLYQHLYLDANSTMAQTIILNPATTWQLDETSYMGGTVLRTTSWCVDKTTGQRQTEVKTLQYFLNVCSETIDKLMNSSTLQVVYTDLLNLASKQGVSFMAMDYLLETYAVFPEYNPAWLLQFHNMNIIPSPYFVTADTWIESQGVTPYNDVYPDANKNALYYNPAFTTVGSVVEGRPRCPENIIVDMLTDAPTVEDRIEVTRWMIGGVRHYITGSGNTKIYTIDAAIPDHYVAYMMFHCTDESSMGFFSSELGTTVFNKVAGYISVLDWCPHFLELSETTHAYTGKFLGDLNFYTVVDYNFLRRLHDFVGLALYDLR